MNLYRERLWPAPWLFIATGLIIPATLIVMAPISMTAGIIIAIVLYLVFVALLLSSSAEITVTETTFRAGRAHVSRAFVGRVDAFDGLEATAERGIRLDARAWLLIRGWVKPVVRIEITDPEDPVPYWLVSSRHARRLADALAGDRPGAGSRD